MLTPFARHARPLLLAAAAFVVTVLPPGAAAQNVTFSGSGAFGFAPSPGNFPTLTAGAFTFSFVVPQSPAVVSSDAGQFSLNPVTVLLTQGVTQTSVSGVLATFPTATGGGFNFFGGFSLTPLLIASPGLQIFTGTTAVPTFTIGSYTVGSNPPGSTRFVPTVTSFSIAAVTTTVPEPGTWALLAIGLIGVAGCARRRQTTGA